MIFEVEMNAFGNGAIRKVNVPDEEAKKKAQFELLELIFKYGQNDFQPQELPSVSVGDVVRLHNEKYEVAMLGFQPVS